jgi:hypothetical protein
MEQLLIFDGGSFIDRLFVRYPRMTVLTHQLMQNGLSPLQSACTLLRLALVLGIEEDVDAAGRDRLADYLVSERERVDPPSALAHWCRIYCWDMLVQSNLGKVPRNWYEDSVMDIYMAANGVPWAERSARRARGRGDDNLPELDPRWLRRVGAEDFRHSSETRFG